jgi:4-alpha-glucanotransferase
MAQVHGLRARGVACRAASTTPAEVAAVGVGEELPEGYEQMTPVVEASQRRRAGVLLHPSSLRGPHGIGDLGDEALAFLEWLRDAGCTLWQVTSDAHFRPRRWPNCSLSDSD